MKNNKSAVFGFVTLGVLTVLMSAMRIFQIVWDIDRITGNLRSSAVDGIIVPITLAIVIITAVIFYILSPEKDVDNSVIHSMPLGFCAIIFAATCIVDGIMGYNDAREKLKAMMEEIHEILDQASAALIGSAEFVADVAFIAMVFSIITAIYFIWLACTYLNHKSRRYPPMFLGLCVPLWFGLKLAGDYIELTNSPVLTEIIYDTLTLSALAIFMMAHIRLLSDICRKNTVRSNFAFGLLSALLAIVFPLPRYFMDWVFGYSVTSSSDISNLVTFATALYIVVFLVYLNKKKNEQKFANPPAPPQPPIFTNNNPVMTMPQNNIGEK